MSDITDANKQIENALGEALMAEEGTCSCYELVMPEGINFSPEERAQFDAQAQELKLDNEGAQKLLEIALRNQLSQTEARNKQMDAWREEIRKDKELGGSSYESTIAYAKAGLKKFDPKGELLSILEQSGYGNNPHIIRCLAAIGRSHAEDKIILGSPSKTEAPRHERLYGKYNSL